MTDETEFRLQRPAHADLLFTGELLADVSSKDNPRQSRWTEIRIYRTTKGLYVTEDIGRSIVPNEKDRVSVHVCSTVDDLRVALQRRQDGRVFLRSLAVQAIREAAVKHPELSTAIEERI